MSVEAITWALKCPIKHSTAKFVLVVMANCADGKDFLCWPSGQYIVDATGQDRKTVQENMRRLQSMGYIEDTGERRGATKQVIVYRLTQPREDDGNRPENGTLPNFPSNRPNFPGEQAQNSQVTGPKTGHGTVKEPSEKQKEPSLRASRLKKDWLLPKKWGEWALQNDDSWTADHVRLEADKFRDYWIGVPGKAGTKLDWEATWRNWCRNAGPMPAAGKAGGGAWWASEDSKLAKAQEVGVGPALPGESAASWEGRIRAAIDNGGKPPELARPAQAVTIRDPGAEEERRGMSEESRAALLAAKQVLKRGPGAAPEA